VRDDRQHFGHPLGRMARPLERRAHKLASIVAA
jgi:hypothetical protein